MTRHILGTTLSDRQLMTFAKIIERWDGYYLIRFRDIEPKNLSARAAVRVDMRALERKGFLERCAAFSEDDGLLRGSGFQPTALGESAAKLLFTDCEATP